MAVMQDPQGAFFMIWQPKAAHRRGARQRARARSCWNELSSPGPRCVAKAFYGGLFGWTFEPFEGSPEPYLAIQNGERGNGGIRALTRRACRRNWLVYFGVDDIDAALAKLERARRREGRGADRHRIGKIAVVRDPQGAHFAPLRGRVRALVSTRRRSQCSAAPRAVALSACPAPVVVVITPARAAAEHAAHERRARGRAAPRRSRRGAARSAPAGGRCRPRRSPRRRARASRRPSASTACRSARTGGSPRWR